MFYDHNSFSVHCRCIREESKTNIKNNCSKISYDAVVYIM